MVPAAGPLHCALYSLDATGHSDSALTLLESEGNYSAVQYIAVHYTVAQYTAVQYTAVQCSVV